MKGRTQERSHLPVPSATNLLRVHLLVHERTHIGKKPNTCFKCDKTFKLICHLKECEKAFEQKAHLQRQDRTNTGKKPFVCFKCYKAFTEAHTVMFLKGHEVTHKGEKLFVCTKFPKKFKEPGNLKKHERTQGKLFACSKCDNTFKEREAICLFNANCFSSM